MADDKQSDKGLPPHIKTEGDYSPGAVYGDYKVTINHTTVQTFEQIKKKSWRPIEILNFAWLGSMDGARQAFGVFLIKTLERLQLGYRRFTMMFEVQSLPSHVLGKPLPKDVSGIVFWCMANQPEIFEGMRKEYKKVHLERTAIEASNSPEDEKAKRRQQHSDELNRIDGEWSTFARGVIFDRNLHAVEVSCDTPSHRIDLQAAPNYSMDLATYPNHGKTTSDLIRFIVSLERAALNSGGFLVIDNIDCICSFYPLQKLWYYYLDHKVIDFAKIRINVDDSEDWDYEYPKLDYEVETWKQQHPPQP